MSSVAIGYIHPGTVRAEFMRSMLNTVLKSQTKVEAIHGIFSGPLIASARNDLVVKFLTDFKSPWLLMIDTDMVWEPSAVDRLVFAAERDRLPILGAMCHSLSPEGEALPTMYELVPLDGAAAFARYQVWPEDQPMEVAGTGAAFLLVHREAFQRIAAGFNDKADRVWPWFRESTMGNRRVGEDLTFCLRAGVAGIKVHVHTGVQVGHMKTTMIGKVS